jgi:hypothetical protein
MALLPVVKLMMDVARTVGSDGSTPRVADAAAQHEVAL